MRKVHLISVTEPLVLDLALALREKGYEVSASGCGLTEEMIGRLHNAGCTCIVAGHCFERGALVSQARTGSIGTRWFCRFHGNVHYDDTRRCDKELRRT